MIFKLIRRRIGESLNDEKRVFGLDVMRAIAISMVLLAHCSWIIGESGGIFSQLLALSGFLGVEIFFVLSGFLIGRILYRNFDERYSGKSVLNFLRRRWFRTLPNYFLVLLINVAIAYFIGYDIDYAWRYFIFMQNFAWPLFPFFPESWSLAVEETAYIMLPLALLLLSFLNIRRSLIFVFVAALLIIISVGAKWVYHVQNPQTTLACWNIALKSVVIFRVDAILTGVVFAWLSIERPSFWRGSASILSVIGVLMMAFFAVGVGMLGLTIERFPLFWDVIYLPLSSVSIACFLPLLSTLRTKPFFWRPVVFISVISYSIYLLHYSIVLQIMKQLLPTESLSSAIQAAFALLYIGITVVASALLYTLFEKPMTELRDTKREVSR